MRRPGPVVAVLVATVIDVGGLLLLVAAGWPLIAADLTALALAAVTSLVLHRRLDRGLDPFVRWVRDPRRYAVVALVAAAVDVAVLLVLAEALGAAVLPAKLAAVVVAALVRVVGQRQILGRAVRGGQAAPASRPAPAGVYRLSVVLPAYHQADVVADSVRRVRAALVPPLAAGELEVIVVDDGSGDDTAERARAAGADQVLVHEVNRGKGAAVRTGFAAARGATVAFTDTDLAYDPRQLLTLLDAVESGWDVAVGSRRHTDAVTLVRARRLREVGGRVINLLTQAVLLGHYRDTQCGLKACRADVAPVVLGQGLVDGFAFDIEVFHLVERHGLSLVEVPVEVVNSEDSSVRPLRDGLRLVRDLFRIRAHAAAGRYARPGPVAGSGAGGPVR